MKIKMKDTRFSPDFGLLEKDKAYEVDEAFGAQLIQQDLAVVVVTDKPTSKEK